MSDNQRKVTGRLDPSILQHPINNATQIYLHQRGAEALAKYSPMVIPMLHELLEKYFGETPGYGIDDNIDLDSDVLRFGWRIFGMGQGEAVFNENTPAAPQRKTLLTVELLFAEMGHATGFLVDTRRTHTTVKTGLLGLKQKVQVTMGKARQTKLSETELADALEEIVQTMER